DPATTHYETNLYSYVTNRPVVATDPSGAIRVIPLDSLLSPKAKCGDNPYQKWFFELGSTKEPFKAPCDGYFVQKVDVYCDIALSCMNCPTDFVKTPTYSYLEAWWMRKTKTRPAVPSKYTDTAIWNTNCCGTYKQVGTIQFFCKYKQVGRKKVALTGDLGEV